MSKSNYYVNGIKKWDVNKFPQTNNNRKLHLNTEPIESNSTGIHSFEGLVCSDITISPDGKGVFISKDKKAADLELDKITSFDRQAHILTINTEDEIPIYLTFKNEGELECTENRFFNVMNGSPDPGCC